MKDAQTRSRWLGEALKKLNEREQMVIRERHMQYETVTLEELGKELGVSKERVRQIEACSLKKLHRTMQNNGLKPILQTIEKIAPAKNP
jgi:RNA polymerase sigma-32 factor